MALAILGACAAGPAQRPAPNVVLILADDLGIGDLGCYNAESKIPTPRLDALAAEGLRFTDAHSPSAVCTPTRYALLTGRYAWRSRMKRGVLQGYSRLLLEPGRATIGSALAAAGYDTGVFGKWHLGLGAFDASKPNKRTDYAEAVDGRTFDAGPHTVGFARSEVIPASLDMAPYCWVADGQLEEKLSADTPGSKRRWSGGGGFWRKGKMSPSFRHDQVQPSIVERACRWIETRDADRPFFCYVPLAAPHTPWLPLDEHAGRSTAGHYGDFVAQIDTGLGRIFDALEATGRADDTIVIVTSDNGSHWRPKDVQDHGHAANLQWRGMKADAWEAGHRVPLLVRWPERIRPGTESDALAGLVDLYATIADAAGVELGDDDAGDSVSMPPHWTGEDPAHRDELICHSMSGWFVLRQGPWKLIDRLGSGGFTAPRKADPQPDGPQGQLYDLAADPGESRNLWLEQPERVERMLARLAELRAQAATRPR